MYLIVITIIGVFVCLNSVNCLTESLGREVIEIGPAIKELPAGLEEEPSGENNEEEPQTMTTIRQSITQQVTNTTVITVSSTPNATKTAAIVEVDDEAKIEKELADMYKDNSDYKMDSNEVNTDLPTSTTDVKKPILRERTSFKFQPDIQNKAEVERFRTSVDEISCEKRSTEKLNAVSEENPISQSASKCFADVILAAIPFLLI